MVNAYNNHVVVCMCNIKYFEVLLCKYQIPSFILVLSFKQLKAANDLFELAPLIIVK